MSSHPIFLQFIPTSTATSFPFVFSSSFVFICFQCVLHALVFILLPLWSVTKCVYVMCEFLSKKPILNVIIWPGYIARVERHAMLFGQNIGCEKPLQKHRGRWDETLKTRSDGGLLWIQWGTLWIIRTRQLLLVHSCSLIIHNISE